MRSYVVFSLALLVAWLAPTGAARAVVTSTWTVDSYEDWDKGEAEAAFITSLGEVKPGWQSDRLDLEVDSVWAAARAGDGSLFLGTDDAGSVYRVRGTEASKLASIDSAVAVVSLALRGSTLYAGTMPAGQIWRIDVNSGKADKLAELDGVETVWALALDAAEGTLYAGTGPDGRLFAVDPRTGEAEEVFDTEDKRITALAATRDGAVWLGTSDRALVFRYDPARQAARAVADFSGNEITALAESGGSVIVAANDFAEPTTSGIKTRAAVAKAKKEPKEGQKPDMPSRGSQPGADKRPTPRTEPKRKHARKGKGALYRVRGDGSLEQLHALTATYFTDVAVTETGTVFAGAGDKGRIYLIDTDDSVSTAFDVDERIIATISYDAERGMMFTTSDAAAAYRVTGRSRKATYLSDVFDADSPSRFGKIVWHAAGNVSVETRSGNTAEPGPGWSEFAPPGRVSSGGGNSRAGQVASPSGRYLQFRIKFAGGDGAVLRKVKLYYLPQNRATRITEIEVNPEGDQSGVTLKSGAAKPRSPVIDIDWSVDNPDRDTTRYVLEVRREGDALWRPIVTGTAGKEFLTTSKYSWNTETFPDGYYRLRVTAIDDRANSADRARQSFRTTPLFLVDNLKPRIDGISVNYPQASARASDAMSAIAEMAYSVDDGPWQVGTTRDGLFDSLTEMLRIRLPKGLAPGVHTLALRVADEAGNIGSASVTFRVE